MTLNKVERVMAKAAIVGAAGGLVSLLLQLAMGGGKAAAVHIMGGTRRTMVPMAVATAGTLAVGSVAAGYLIPVLTQNVLKVAPGTTLSKIENMLLEPAMVALSCLAVTVPVALCPECISDAGGVMSEIVLGGGSQILASYVVGGMGWGSVIE